VAASTTKAKKRLVKANSSSPAITVISGPIIQKKHSTVTCTVLAVNPNVTHTNEDEDDDNNGADWDLTNNPLIDLPDETQPTSNSKGGHPWEEILDELLVRCYHQKKPMKILYQCIGQLCMHTFSSQTIKCAIRHAAKCFELMKELRELAREEAMKNSVSKKLVNLDTDDQEIMEGGAVKKMKTNNGFPKPISLLEQAQACGKKKRHTLLDLAVIRLFCIHGLPTHLVGTPE